MQYVVNINEIPRLNESIRINLPFHFNTIQLLSHYNTNHLFYLLAKILRANCSIHANFEVIYCVERFVKIFEEKE